MNAADFLEVFKVYKAYEDENQRLRQENANLRQSLMAQDNLGKEEKK